MSSAPLRGWPWDAAAGLGADDVIVIEPGGPLVGRIRVPGDKSVSHRALLLAALADGRSLLTGLSNGDDVRRTALALVATGADVTAAPRPSTDPLAPGLIGPVHVDGGRRRLHEPDGPIDVGNSGTGMRLLAGWLAPFEWFAVLHGDRSLARRPMERVCVPLRLMGAAIDGRGGGRFAPLAVRGGALRGIDYALGVPSAQVKGAMLLAGLGAEGTTTVREPAPVRAHTEELLAAFGADVDVREDGAVVAVRGGELRPRTIVIPGDPSQAAFWLVAACIVPGSDVTVEGVYVGRARATFLDVLARMGADVDVTMLDATTASVRARHGELRGTVVGGDEVAGLVDEIPALAVAAACARGMSEFRDAAELRVKESDRVATTTAALAAMGAAVECRDDGFSVGGGGGLHGGEVDAAGDHRIAMAAAVAALTADGPTRVRGWAAVATSYPSFLDDLQALRR